MSLAAIAASVGGDALNGLMNHSLAMRRQKQAQGFESDMFQQRYQMTVSDLKAAGLNPMLAYTQGVGSAPSSSAAGASLSSSAGSDAVSSYNTTKIASAQEALLRAQKRNVEAQTAQTTAQTVKTSAETDIKTPRATLMRGLENVLQGFMGNSAMDKKNRKLDFGRDPQIRYNPKEGWDKFKGGMKYIFKGGSK